MKIVLILLDGIGDRAYRAFGGRTPLQEASTPNLDRLAQMGGNGLFHASFPGQSLPSETAHFLLFGYDMRHFPGRGLLEAAGEGLDFKESDVLCLSHLSGVTWREGIPILTEGRDEIQGRPGELEALYGALTPYETGGVCFRLEKTRRNDGILVLRGDVSPFISDSDPILKERAIARVFPLDGNREAESASGTASALNHYLGHCHRVLSEHRINRQRMSRGLPPANFLVTQRSGRRVHLEPFGERWGMKGMLISSGAVYGGLAHELGLSFKRVEDGPDPCEDLRERIRLALDDPSHDFIHVHTKIPDEASHKGDPSTKRDAIALLDGAFDELGETLKTEKALLVAVTSDHSTPSDSTLIHSGEPVPVTIVGRNVRQDGVRAFDEVSGASGCLGFLRGQELMLMLMNYADRTALAGHRLGPCDRPYMVENYQPFESV